MFQLYDIAIIIFSLVVLAISSFTILRKKNQLPQGPIQPQQQQQQQLRQQQQQQNQRQQVQQTRRNVVLDSSEEEENEDDLHVNRGNDRESKKQQKKEQQESLREQFKQKQEAQDKKTADKRSIYDEREQLREEEDRKAEEWRQKIEEDVRKQEAEDYDKWKDMFTVEAQGQVKLSEDEELAQLRNMMDKFVKYIKLRKVVQLEDMSSEFKIPTKEVIDRIKSLEMNKQLNGIIDERGKYIYLTESELLSVKNFIEAKGSVGRSDLMRECNQIIKLDPSAQDNQELAIEENELLEQVSKEIQQLKD